MWVGPSRYIACCIDSGDARFEIVVHYNTSIECQAGLFGEPQARPHADAGDHKIGIEHGTGL